AADVVVGVEAVGEARRVGRQERPQYRAVITILIIIEARFGVAALAVICICRRRRTDVSAGFGAGRLAAGVEDADVAVGVVVVGLRRGAIGEHADHVALRVEVGVRRRLAGLVDGERLVHL